MIDIAATRAQFPALRREVGDHQASYLDGPGGSQVPISVIQAMDRVLSDGVSNLTPLFAAGRAAIRATNQARRAVADLLGAASPDAIVFGQNMTSLTFAFSRAIARTWSAGDHIIVTALDHDANRTPWVLAAEDRGVQVTEVPFDTETFTLDPQSVADAITPRTRLVAVTYASNALGTLVDVSAITTAAHAAGALVYVDAVHYAPHGLIDVGAIGCDFLAVSAYKFFGPHTGMVYGRPELLESLDAYKVRPSPASGPAKWETGTQSFESLAGVSAAVDYLSSLGEGETRRVKLAAGYAAIGEHERMLGARFLDGVSAIDRIQLYGISTMDGRVPTFTIDVAGMSARDVAAHLGKQGIFVWDGHYYAVGVMESLGLFGSGGLVRIGFLHYTSVDEVDRLLEALSTL